MATTNATQVQIGVLWSGDPSAPTPAPESTRLRRIFEELAARGVQAEPVVYVDEAAGLIRERLLTMDGVLVWVNPIVQGRDRSVLDALLRDIASQGVFVSAHPDVILQMGTKDVLYRTRTMAWGTDTRLYSDLNELSEQLPSLLQSSGPRVLKRHRGNGGDGVWRVEVVPNASLGAAATVRVQQATRPSQAEELAFGDFVERCRPYFAGTGCVIDQPFQPRLADGMIRCYLVQDRVVGFGHHFVTALMPAPPGQSAPPEPPRVYYGPSKPEFQSLKQLLESDWIAQMEHLLDLDRESLPMIWDADFLLGPKDASGEDTYVLCEINVSSVLPIPDEAFAPLAEATVARIVGRRVEHGSAAPS
jgi:hypothetical protein